MQTHIDLPFADGVYRFALGLDQLHELQTKCRAGIGAIYARVLAGRVPDQPEIGHPLYAAYQIDDLVETIRQGLIGGGEGLVDGQPVTVTPMRANDLVSRYGPNAPGVSLSDLWTTAAAILFAKIEGYSPPDGAEPSPIDDKKKATPTTATDG